MPAPSVTICGGSREQDPAVLDLARRVGAAIVRRGLTLCCGGRGGVMEAACEGAAAVGPPGSRGIIVGILPTADKSDANPHCDVVLPTGIGYARNSLVVLAGDVVILIGGATGTLCEAAFAWQYGKPIVALAPSGGWAKALAGTTMDDRRGDQVWPAQDPEEAVAKAVELIGDPPRIC
jgi:uncharacterized protein (TIGR00725 family)